MELVEKIKRENYSPLYTSKFLEGKDVWEMEYGPIKIDKKYSSRFMIVRGDIRLSLGLYHTPEEYEKERNRVLELSLP